MARRQRNNPQFLPFSLWLAKLILRVVSITSWSSQLIARKLFSGQKWHFTNGRKIFIRQKLILLAPVSCLWLVGVIIQWDYLSLIKALVKNRPVFIQKWPILADFEHFKTFWNAKSEIWVYFMKTDRHVDTINIHIKYAQIWKSFIYIICNHIYIMDTIHNIYGTGHV